MNRGCSMGGDVSLWVSEEEAVDGLDGDSDGLVGEWGAPVVDNNAFEPGSF